MVEELDLSVCWELLRRAEVGRLAVVVEGEPEIFPVNHVVDRGTIVLRTAPGTKLRAAASGAAVAFEVDGLDVDTGVAWSVVVKGTGHEIQQLHDLLDTFELPLVAWHGDLPKHRFVRIEPRSLTGRRFQANRPDSADTASSRRAEYE